MRAILLAIVTVSGAAPAMSVGPADAQCSVFSRQPCVPNVCSVLSRHPCVPEPVYPFSEDLRLTIVSAAPDRAHQSLEPAVEPEVEGSAATERRLDTIHAMFDALRACWVPPPQEAARPGMQMSVRLSFRRSGEVIGAPRVTYASPDAPAAARDIYHDAILAALERCTPMPFTPGLGGAVAGRPVAIRFVDDRATQ
jgi:hypothetical protein